MVHETHSIDIICLLQGEASLILESGETRLRPGNVVIQRGTNTPGTTWCPVLTASIESFEVRDGAALEQRMGEADVLVISGLWRNDLLPRAKRLRFIQSIGAGTDQFSRESLKQHGVRLASARGVNARAVSEHLMALMLALARRLPEARDNQAKRVWRGMIGDLTQREDELGGKTLLIVGLGQIGGRLAQLAKAFEVRVIGIRRDPRAGGGRADAVHAVSDLHALLPQADFVALTCPLTAETRPRSTRKNQLFQVITKERHELTKDKPKIAGACVAVCGRLVSFALLALNRPGSRAQRRL